MDNNFFKNDFKQELVFMDLETFNVNLNFYNNRPWQVGMIKVVNKDRIVDKFDEMVKWDCDLSISEEAARITRFDKKKFNKLARDESEIFPTVYEWLDNCDYIVGHNILGFDMYLIRDWCKMHGKPYNHLFKKCIDTLSVGRGIRSEHYFKKQEENFFEYQYRLLSHMVKGVRAYLSELGKYYNIEHNYATLHDAINDLELNLKVWRKLKLEMSKI